MNLDSDPHVLIHTKFPSKTYNTEQRLQCPVLSSDQTWESLFRQSLQKRKEWKEKGITLAISPFVSVFLHIFFSRHLFKHNLNLFSSCSLISHHFVALSQWPRIRYMFLQGPFQICSYRKTSYSSRRFMEAATSGPALAPQPEIPPPDWGEQKEGPAENQNTVKVKTRSYTDGLKIQAPLKPFKWLLSSTPTTFTSNKVFLRWNSWMVGSSQAISVSWSLESLPFKVRLQDIICGRAEMRMQLSQQSLRCDL